MKLVDALVRVLRDWNVRYVFGVSGANIEHLHDAIHRLGDGRLVSVLSKSETGAAFMADGRARVHNTLGVCCATSGGGMLNLAVGIAESYAESVPVLAIVGQPSTVLEGRGAFQDSSGIGHCVDAVQLWQSVAKHVAKLTSGAEFWTVLRRAVETALSGRRGPAVLLIPRDVYDAEVGSPPADWPCELSLVGKAPVVSNEQALYVMRAIRSARRPVLLVGQGVRRSDDGAAVREFAAKVRIPVATTMSARAEFSHNDALYLGTVGAAGHPSAHHYLNEEADLIIAAGTSLDIMTRVAIERSFGSKRFVLIDVDTESLARVVQPELAVRADAGQVFRALLRVWQDDPFEVSTHHEGVRSYYAAVLAEPICDDASSPENDDELTQSKALAILEPVLPRAGHILFDAGNCAAAAMHYHHVPAGATSTIALGMGGMGYSIPAAIGAQLGEKRGTRTVVIAGDGAFLMLGLEVHTAIDLRLPILFVVFNNAMHGMCVTRQQKFFASRIEAVRYSRVDFAAMSRGLAPDGRLWTGSARSARELREQLLNYTTHHAHLPGVIDIHLAREEVPPFAPFLASDAPTWRSSVAQPSL